MHKAISARRFYSLSIRPLVVVVVVFVFVQLLFAFCAQKVEQLGRIGKPGEAGEACGRVRCS